VQRSAHAQRTGPQAGTPRTASGSPSCTSTGCCGPASSRRPRWLRTRYRKKLIGQRASEGQRLAKVLEDIDIKIDSVASQLLGKSGRAMIEALIAGERNPGVLADLALGVPPQDR